MSTRHPAFTRVAHPRFARLAIALTVSAFVAACGGDSDNDGDGNGGPKAVAETVYKNGFVITVDKDDSTAQAVAIKDGKILAVGSDSAIEGHVGADTKVVDLAGKTMIPGIYDAHSHFSGPNDGEFSPNLKSPPLGPIATMDDLVASLDEYKTKLPQGDWISASGYDDTGIAEKRHPTKDDLDRVSTTTGVTLGHISGHLSTVNSYALAAAGITRDTPNPPGGIIFKDENGEPTGVLGELASNLVSRVRPPSAIPAAVLAEQSSKTTTKSIHWYASHGVTTANYGCCVTKGVLESYESRVKDGTMPIRMMAWSGIDTMDSAATAVLPSGKIKLGGVKLFDDGSIQGFTGYLSEPYYTPFEGDHFYRAFPRLTREELASEVLEIHKSGRQAFVHCNGDASIDDCLYAFRKAQETDPRPDARHTIIHAQMMREDQLDDAKALGVIPSFFVLHTYYWGDRHREIFMGPERANRISPAGSAKQRDMIYTIHTDANVVPMEPMRLIWSAVNRYSTSGAVMGAGQRIPVADALRATTLNAAYQNFQEKELGSIEVGKLADLAILDKNLYKVDPDAIKDIKVLETIVEGKSVYVAD